MGMGIDKRKKMARRAAEEIRDGMIVNLGIGIPSLVPDFLPESISVMFHAENGITGMGPSPVKGQEDPHLCNAGGFPVTSVKGASYCDSTIAFGMIRRGRVDLTFLGSLQVSGKGDLANWIVPGRKVPGMGGAMELAQKAKRVIVVMNQTDKNGMPKILEHCTLPLTSPSCASLVITEMAVFEIKGTGMVLKELFAPYSIEEVKSKTGCRLQVAEDLRIIV
ncbi:3-oxoacid CoA-transferase subunit B [Bacillus sp. UMB0728]|uniref:3-oxoacid CoA-transferase subunit B n=1 Tax=Bacillus sp. UMB0728 TaxID=2066052 RepID=UPI000C77A37B|nr:3-oxoacid CoA-transferase subunit B [Bacillus sp. UMB0728]PLR72108.1 acyl CoA:acetate/3-ketoacid CoA transferase subunit beta [Bacillus sp. UMB0728]